MRPLSLNHIVRFNKRILLSTGGFLLSEGNVANMNSLEYLVDDIRTKVKSPDVELSPFEAAAIYAHHIITRHIFRDGNKRTGILVALVFLKMNGYEVVKQIADQEIIDLALRIQRNEIDVQEVAEWLAEITRGE